MSKGSYRLFFVFLIGMVLAAVGLIMLAPGLAESRSTLYWVISVALGLTVVGCAFAVKHVRPDRRAPK